MKKHAMFLDEDGKLLANPPSEIECMSQEEKIAKLNQLLDLNDSFLHNYAVESRNDDLDKLFKEILDWEVIVDKKIVFL